MEDQVELIKKIKKITRFNDLQLSDIEEWAGLSKSQFYKASVGQKELEKEILDQMREKIELFYETGMFKMLDKPKQRIDYDLLHEIDKDYMTNNGSWTKEAYDDPRLKHILYYEDDVE